MGCLEEGYDCITTKVVQIRQYITMYMEKCQIEQVRVFLKQNNLNLNKEKLRFQTPNFSYSSTIAAIKQNELSNEDFAKRN